MNHCKHNKLDRLEGPLHPGGKDYRCIVCGEQLRAEVLTVGVTIGPPAESAKGPGQGVSETERAKNLLHALDSCPFADKQARLDLIERTLKEKQLL